MSFEKFLNLIDRTPFGAIVDKKRDIVEKTNPDRIYVENIREFYNLPYVAAKTLCEIAVRERIFKKKIGVICPNDECKRIIKSYDIDEDQDEILTCIPCSLREEEKYSFNTKELDKIIFYQLQG
jgi:hypothetical protein